MADITITIRANTVDGATTAFFRLGDEIHKATQYIPTFCAGVNWFNSGNAEIAVDSVDFFGSYDRKKAKYLRRYHRRGEQMRKKGRL